MSTNITSRNPAVQAIISGAAPEAARMAAARGLLPLPQADLLEVLVALATSNEQQISSAAQATLDSQEPETLLEVAKEPETAPAVLGFLAARPGAGPAVHEAIALNHSTPDDAIALLARMTTEGRLLELIAVNQQRLIRAPGIIDSILSNPARTPEADRRAKETQREFFEKERGAQQIAQEMRARGMNAAAEFTQAVESLSIEGLLNAEDVWAIASHIEVSDADIDDSWLAHELIEEIFEETPEQRLANAERVISESRIESGDLPPERVSLIRRVMLMTVKDRLKLAMKGDREARAILIRDSNRLVAVAVIHNPRITEQEIESIASMRTVSDEVLRLIALNRAWARSYSIIHNLARNPRTPIATSMAILPRIRTKDLTQMKQNRNIPEAVRRQAQRLGQMRAGH